MAFVVQVTLPGMTVAQYDELRDIVGWLDEAPQGGIAHLMWEEADGLHGTDVWESEEAWNAFGMYRLGPALAKLGIDMAPEAKFVPAHEVYVPAAATIV